MTVLEVYEFKLEGYNKRSTNAFDSFGVSPKGRCSVLRTTNAVPTGDREAETRGEERFSCDLLGNDETRPLLHSPLLELYRRFPTRIDLRYLQRNVRVYREIVRGAFPDPLLLLERARAKLAPPPGSSIEAGYLLTADAKPVTACVGDLHGSYHTFVRNLFRLDLMGFFEDFSALRLRESHAVLLTGDVVNRGFFSWDVLQCILAVMAASPPGCVLYVRGNHEDPAMTAVYGFDEEVRTKFPARAGCLLRGVHQFFAALPCAVVLRAAEGNLWFSHGGFPSREGRSIFRFDPARRTTPLSREDTRSTLWNDLHWGGPGQTFRRAKKTGRDVVFSGFAKAFMEENDLVALVRGHMDNFRNTVLMSSASPVGLALSQVREAGAHANVRVRTEAGPGPIATISWARGRAFQEQWVVNGVEHSVLPVLTVTSCTERLKSIVRDSFVLLRAGKAPPAAPKILSPTANGDSEKDVRG